MNRAVFLDRDGVLNRTVVDAEGVPHPPAHVAELQILPGVAAALDRLTVRGFLLVVVTNQPDVARGRQRHEDVEAINQSLAAQLPLTAVYACYHDNADRCECRKPKPGLLTRAAAELDIDLKASFMVGDRWSDIVAGTVAGCRDSYLVQAPYSESHRCSPAAVVKDVGEAADLILAGGG